MRVLHVQKVSGIGGSERHLLNLLPALAARGIEVRMCVLATLDADLFTGPALALGIDTVVVPAGLDVNPRMVARLYAQLRDFRADLVHTHLVHADVHGQVAARLGRIPSVSSVHGIPPFYRCEPYRSAGRVAGRLARRTIAISEHVAACVRDLGLAPAARIRVVHYGMDASGWQLRGQDRFDARAALGLDPAEVAVGVASRLVPHKGHACLIEAIRSAVIEVPGIRLLVAGTGPSEGELRDRASAVAADSVRFVGFVNDVRRFMNACDIIVFPTEPEFGEGFGLAALEAMAAARPLVVTDVGPLRELVVDGLTGLIVPPGDAVALSRAIVKLALDPGLQNRLGEAAAGRATKRFGLDAMADKTVAVYEEARRPRPLGHEL